MNGRQVNPMDGSQSKKWPPFSEGFALATVEKLLEVMGILDSNHDCEMRKKSYYINARFIVILPMEEICWNPW